MDQDFFTALGKRVKDKPKSYFYFIIIYFISFFLTASKNQSPHNIKYFGLIFRTL